MKLSSLLRARRLESISTLWALFILLHHKTMDVMNAEMKLHLAYLLALPVLLVFDRTERARR